MWALFSFPKGWFASGEAEHKKTATVFNDVAVFGFGWMDEPTDAATPLFWWLAECHR